jgi:hypothetical protein
MMVNNNLVGGAVTILKNDGVRKNGKDEIPIDPFNMKWKIIQPCLKPTTSAIQLRRSLQSARSTALPADSSHVRPTMTWVIEQVPQLQLSTFWGVLVPPC